MRTLAQIMYHLGGLGWVDSEFPFRPTAEFNEWACDVGYLSPDRWDDEKAMLIGAPDLVIEVLSPSNKNLKMNRREAVCLANGCRQFWLLDPELKIVKVTTPDRKTITYDVRDHIDLAEFGGGKLAVETLFR